MTILDEIVNWGNNLDPWQSDAMRRLWVKRDLSDEDVSEILLMLKAEHGLIDPNIEVPTPEKFEKKHISIPAPGEPKVILESIHDVKNVNALSENQTINFTPKGITVVYGENATGKSGYSRILRKACRSRGESESILPNIHASQPPTSPAEAIFDVTINSTNMPLSWVDSKNEPEELKEIAVFDSKTARVYITKTNKVVYVPYGLDIFTKLSDLCVILKDKIQFEIDGLDKPPEILEELVGKDKPISQLNHETSIDEIKKIAEFADSHKKRLHEIRKILIDIEATDPKIKASSMSRQKARIDRLKEDLIGKGKLLNDINITKIQRLWQEAKTTKEAAQVSSDMAFQEEPLPGVGTDAWREMFLAAKRYSEESAYPTKLFPVIDEGSLCLLCQQKLNEEAKDRLKRFWDFIQQETTRNAQEKRALYKKALGEITGKDYDVQDPQLLEDIKDMDPDGYHILIDFINNMKVRAESIIKSHETGDWDNIYSLSQNPSYILSKLSKKCASMEQHYLSIAKPAERESLQNEVKRLETRKKLYENQDKLLKHIEMLKLDFKLKQCDRTCTTTGITRKRTELINIAINKDLKKSLEDELNSLGGNHLKFEFITSGEYGETYLQLKISNSLIEDVKIDAVLSEGEQRLVAIASFLAELNIGTSKCGIVFDDPVCSLDHVWREKFAKRIVNEAKIRQVVIFTHDIVLLLAIEHEAAVQKVQIRTQTVKRFASEIGICDQELPIPAMKVKDRIGHLKNLHPSITSIRRNGDISEYRKEIGHVYGLLREAWERSIEEKLFADVIQRYRPSIQTLSLRYVPIPQIFFRTIYFAMERCSRWMTGHDQAPSTTTSYPEPDEVLKDIEEFDTFVSTLNKRRKIYEKRLLLSIKPPEINK